MPLVLVLERQRLADLFELEVSLVYQLVPGHLALHSETFYTYTQRLLKPKSNDKFNYEYQVYKCGF